jgi:hypothetical protein
LLGPDFPILGRLRPARVATPVIAVDDDPATLARLAAIMSDRVRPCPNCGGDPHVCRAIGCDAEPAQLLLSQPTVDRPEAWDLPDDPESLFRAQDLARPEGFDPPTY